MQSLHISLLYYDCVAVTCVSVASTPAHRPVVCSPTGRLLTDRSSAHRPFVCSPTGRLLTDRSPAHRPVVCSPTGRLLTDRSSAHRPVVCSSTGRLLIDRSSAHRPVVCSPTGRLMPSTTPFVCKALPTRRSLFFAYKIVTINNKAYI